MKPWLQAILVSFLVPALPVLASVLPPDDPSEVILNNRILTTVNGKTISLLDVVKQMDVFLSQYYPEYLDSKPACLQFYSTQWKPTLQRMIDQELMMADAESREIKATDAEVREEIQNRYGPNVMASLDRLRISYDEAKAMTHQDLVVQKIQWFRVTSKVLGKVTTEVIRKAYDRYLKENPPKEVWTYQFLTFRYDTSEAAMPLAAKIVELYEPSNGTLSIAADLFKQNLPEEEWSHLSLSSEFQLDDHELSSAHRDILSQLAINSWSAPTLQQSRDGTQVVRIFHLKAHTKQETPLFETISNQLRQGLLNEYAEAEMQVYLSRLHQRFDYHEDALNIPPHFEPFSPY